MPGDYLTVAQVQRELRDAGITVTGATIRAWCKRHGFGIRLVPSGPWHVHRAKLAPLKAHAASLAAYALAGDAP
jgi:hypothetical protein